MKEGQVSSTALLIARAAVLVDATPKMRPVLLPGSAEWSLKWLDAAGATGWFEVAMQYPLMRRALFWMESKVAPGLLLHFFTRKRWLAQAAQEALAAGIRQIVVIGAGLDSLAWRLKAQRPDLLCIELDHPDTQAAKATAKGPEEQLQPLLIPLDLMLETPDMALKRVGEYDPSQPTFFIAEGLFMYLPGERVEEILSRLAVIAAPGSRFAFSFMEAKPGRRLGFKRGHHRSINWWLRWRREPFRWGLARDEATDFVARHGWTLKRLSSRAEMRQQVLAPLGCGLERLPLAGGESLALLEKSK